MIRLPYTFLFMLSLTYGSLVAAFTDVSVDHPAAIAIANLSEQRVIFGYADNTFRPEQLLNRAEAITVLARAFSIPTTHDYITSSYEDIAPNTWYLPVAEVMFERGIIVGAPATSRFYGERPVTRAEFFTLLQRLDTRQLHNYAQETKMTSEDVRNSTDWYYAPLTQAVAAGVLVPTADGYLYPDTFVNRAETALFLNRYLQYVNGKSVERNVQLFNTTLQDFFIEYSAEDDSDRAMQLSHNLILLTYGLLDAEPNNNDFKSMQKVAWAIGKLTQGEEEQAADLLRAASQLSPTVMEHYNTIINQSYGALLIDAH